MSTSPSLAPQYPQLNSDFYDAFEKAMLAYVSGAAKSTVVANAGFPVISSGLRDAPLAAVSEMGRVLMSYVGSTKREPLDALKAVRHFTESLQGQDTFTNYDSQLRVARQFLATWVARKIEGQLRYDDDNEITFNEVGKEFVNIAQLIIGKNWHIVSRSEEATMKALSKIANGSYSE